MVEQVKPLAEELGDELDLLRLTWLSGRIAGGLGRPEEALQKLHDAREGFEARDLWYDVALALLEIAVLLLDLGRTAEVKALAHCHLEFYRKAEALLPPVEASMGEGLGGPRAQGGGRGLPDPGARLLPCGEDQGNRRSSVEPPAR